MKQFFEIARNILSISAPAELSVWNELRPRFEVFGTAEQPTILDVVVTAGEIADDDNTIIYAPEFSGVGFITGTASRTPKGNIVMQFRHIDEKERIRLRMELSDDFSRAEILIDTNTGKEENPYFLTHALMLAFLMATTANGTLLIHSSAVGCDGKGYLFQGKSGTGKSTHARMWLNNIEGAELLNDDNPLIRFTEDGVPTVYGSPWSGKTPCYRKVSAPIGAFVRIVRGPDNVLKRLAPLPAYESLTTSIFHLPFMTEEQRDVRHRTIERLVQSVPCCEMHCRPDAEAAEVCPRELTTHSR